MPKYNKPDDDPNQRSDELLIRLLEQSDNKEEFNIHPNTDLYQFDPYPDLFILCFIYEIGDILSD